MKKNNVYLLVLVFALLASACSKSNKEAENYLQDIQSLYQEGNYELAKQKIDSIQILYPKAFDQIKEGMALLQDVRRAQDSRQVAYCDSSITILSSRIDSLKQSFVYERDKEYEEMGRFLPKPTSGKILTSTMLRSGVNEDGSLYIESVYIGGQYHNKVYVADKDGSYAETLEVSDDGLNFRFNDMGKQYEVIKFGKSDENGVAKFIYACMDKPLTVTLKGKNSTSYLLSAMVKKSIADAYQLSTTMLEMDSLNNVKEIAQKRLEYLDIQKEKKEQQDNAKQ